MAENEYLFYYNEIDPEKTQDNGSYIWYFRTNAPTLTEALKEFLEYGADDSQIIQVIVKNVLQ